MSGYFSESFITIFAHVSGLHIVQYSTRVRGTTSELNWMNQFSKKIGLSHFFVFQCKSLAGLNQSSATLLHPTTDRWTSYVLASRPFQYEYCEGNDCIPTRQKALPSLG